VPHLDQQMRLVPNLSLRSYIRPERLLSIDLRLVCKGPPSCLKKAAVVVEQLEQSSKESVLPETGTIGGPDHGESSSIR
jgi:hypothetical protein